MGAVPVHAHRLALDQRGAATGARSLAGAGGGGEDRLHVVAVDLDPREPVAGRALHRVDGELVVVGGGVGELVVLEDEHDRQPANAGHIHGLVPDAVRGGALPEPGHRDARLVPDLEREPQPARHERHVGQHRDHPDAAEVAVAEVHVAVAAAGDPGGPAHHLCKDPARPDAPDQVRAEVAVEHACPVARAKRVGAADRHRLLAVSVVVRTGHLALPVEGERAFLGRAHEQHVPVETGAVIAREEAAAVLAAVERRGSRGRRGHLFSLLDPRRGLRARSMCVRAPYGVSAWRASSPWYRRYRAAAGPGRRFESLRT